MLQLEESVNFLRKRVAQHRLIEPSAILFVIANMFLSVAFASGWFFPGRAYSYSRASNWLNQRNIPLH